METTFTVLGFYEDNGQAFAIHVDAKDGLDAMRKVALDHVNSDKESCTLIAAICGALHDRGARSEETERQFGALTFAGESVVDAETYLTAFNKED